MRDILPKDWEIANLGSLSKKIQDGNYGPDYPRAYEFVPEGIPFLTGKALATSGINYSKIDYITEEKHQAISKAHIQYEDVLFANRGSIGTAAMVPKELDGGNIGPQVTLVRTKRERLLPQFLYYFFQSDLFFKQAYQVTAGSALAFFGLATTAKFKIPLPPLPEQRKIAEILTAWDEAIAKTEQLIAALQERKKGLMQRLLTPPSTAGQAGQVRFPGFDGEWEEIHLQEIAKVIMGQSPGSSAYNNVGIGLPLIQGNANISNRRTAPKVYTSKITKQCDIGDIILSVRAPVGETAISIHEACIGRGVCAIRATKCDSRFLYHLLVSNEQQWQRLAQGSTFTAINSTDIRRFLLSIPETLDEQKRIGLAFDTCDEEIELHQTQLVALQHQKKGLMQRLLTGEVRVRVDDEVGRTSKVRPT